MRRGLEITTLVVALLLLPGNALGATGRASLVVRAVYPDRVWAGYATPSQDVDQLSRQAEEAAARGDWTSARDLLRRAVRADPQRVEIRFDLGVALENNGQADEAVTVYRETVLARPNFVPAVERLAALLAERGDMDGAVYVLSAALERLPREGRLYYQFAVLLLRREQGIVAGAVEALQRARDLGYSPPHLFLLLGRVSRLDGKARVAVELLEQGLRQAPEDPELLHELGLSLVASDKADEAIGTLIDAQRRAPEDASIAVDLALAYLQVGNAAAALTALRPYEHQDDPDLVYVLAKAQRALGKAEAADTIRRYQEIQARAKAERESSTRAMVEVNAGVEAWGAGDLGAAATHFEAAARYRPGWTPARAYLAAAVFELGDVNRAVSIATEILGAEPRNAQALMVLGRARMLSAPGEGLELLEKAVELYPFRPVCLLTLGEAYATLGRLSEALALAEQAGEIDPDNTWARQLRDRLRTPRER